MTQSHSLWVGPLQTLSLHGPHADLKLAGESTCCQRILTWTSYRYPLPPPLQGQHCRIHMSIPTCQSSRTGQYATQEKGIHTYIREGNTYLHKARRNSDESRSSWVRRLQDPHLAKAMRKFRLTRQSTCSPCLALLASFEVRYVSTVATSTYSRRRIHLHPNILHSNRSPAYPLPHSLSRSLGRCLHGHYLACHRKVDWLKWEWYA